jgi:hypothetical protein
MINQYKEKNNDFLEKEHPRVKGRSFVRCCSVVSRKIGSGETKKRTKELQNLELFSSGTSLTSKSNARIIGAQDRSVGTDRCLV